MFGIYIFVSSFFFNGGVSFIWEKDKFGDIDFKV